MVTHHSSSSSEQAGVSDRADSGCSRDSGDISRYVAAKRTRMAKRKLADVVRTRLGEQLRKPFRASSGGTVLVSALRLCLAS